MSSIEQRQQTIERIAGEILKFQNDFFEEGVSALKPLTMNQVAETIEVHETTVSRAIANKYLETPHGTFPFKYFFTAGYENAEGEAISTEASKTVSQNHRRRKPSQATQRSGYCKPSRQRGYKNCPPNGS